MLRGNTPEIFLDTDVSFDIISRRDPHYASSVKLLELAWHGKVGLMISESSLANLFYLSFDIYKVKEAPSRLQSFIGACKMVSSGKGVALQALQSPFKDKEDALQFYTARHANADYFITRNIKDYKIKDSSLPVFLPDEFLKTIG
jgi:predicted nucleic acid-binding protein